MRPITALVATTHTTLTRNRHSAMKLPDATTTATTSIDERTGTDTSRQETRNVRCSENRTLAANTTARFATTPTTAAVIAASAAASRRLPRSRSTDGAPRKIHRKLGTKVAHAVTSAPTKPAATGSRAPGSLNAARKPTNTTTRISGPGVVSARLNPTAISPEESQPKRMTAAWLT